MKRGIVLDGDVGIQGTQLLQGILHRQDAADHNGGAGINGCCLSCENLGKVLIHTCCYVLMLLGTNSGQVALPSVGFIIQQLYFVEGVFTKSRKFATQGSLLQYLVGIFVEIAIVIA